MGTDFSVALKPDGTVWTWGGNSYRQLGYGETATGALSLLQQWTPLPLGVTGVRAIAAASQAVFALREDGTVLSWGAQPASGAGYGLLGRATCTLPHSTPGRRVRAEGIGLTNVRGIAAGSLHGLAVDADGYVWAWGYNNQGQLGDNTTTSRWQPQIVPGLSGVVEVAAGGHVSYARKSDGTVWVWGNPYLGNGSGGLLTPPIKTPVQVTGLPAVTRIWAGYGNGYACAADGTLWVWGVASAGQLGFGTTGATPNFLPAQHPTLSPVLWATGGEQHSVVVLDSGGGRAMGHNMHGDIGDGTWTMRTSPAVVTAVPALRRVGSGWHHTLAIGQDGSGWAWGLNDWGQIGNNSATNLATPVQIFAPGFFSGCTPAIAQPSPLAPAAGGGVSSVSVQTAWDCEWTVTSDQSWAQPEPDGTGSASFDVTVGVNPTAPRSASLTVTAKWSGTPTQTMATIPVNQAGYAIVPPTNEEISYFHTDAIGSVRMITSATGSVLARYDYLPFGTEWTTSFSTTTNNVKFTGQERDPETANGGWAAQDYFGARSFQNQTGRFSRSDDLGFGDPLDPQSMNLYAYSRNNPLRFVDPDGHQFQLTICGNCDEETERARERERRVRETWMMAQQFFRESARNLDRQLAIAASISAGFGDALTGRMLPGVNTSLTEYVRQRRGTDGVVAKNGLAYTAGGIAGGTIGWSLVGTGSATIAAIRNGKNGKLFGRGKDTLFNSRDSIRFGWNWKGDWDTGRDVIRLGIGPKRGTRWWSHIDFWYP